MTRSSIEVSPDEIEEIAFNSGQPIEFPPGAGWARIIANGRAYRAWVCAPGRAS